MDCFRIIGKAHILKFFQGWFLKNDVLNNSLLKMGNILTCIKAILINNLRQKS